MQCLRITFLALSTLMAIMAQPLCAENTDVAVGKEITGYLDTVERYLQNLGKKITDCSDLKQIHSVLQQTYRADKHPIEPIGTSYVSFANADGFILVSGKLGILEHQDRKDIKVRSYFDVAKQDEPGRLKFASYDMSLFKGGQVFPTLMKIQDARGKEGYLVLGLRTHEFIERIKKSAHLSEDAAFVFPDGNRVASPKG